MKSNFDLENEWLGIQIYKVQVPSGDPLSYLPHPDRNIIFLVHRIYDRKYKNSFWGQVVAKLGVNRIASRWSRIRMRWSCNQCNAMKIK